MGIDDPLSFSSDTECVLMVQSNQRLGVDVEGWFGWVELLAPHIYIAPLGSLSEASEALDAGDKKMNSSDYPL